MTTLQFSLFFAALLVAYVLVHIRLTRFEGYLREIAGLKLLNERLKGVSDVLERIRLDRVEERLDMLHEDLGEVVKATGRVERSVRAVVLEPAAPRQDAPVTRSATERARALVEARLLSLGYRDLRILTDLRDVDLDEEVEVRVECERQGMPHKGRVTLRNEGVADIQLQSVAQSFT